MTQAEFVKTTLMPKGVEHSTSGVLYSAPAAVKTTLMPKGVEHKMRDCGDYEFNE